MQADRLDDLLSRRVTPSEVDGSLMPLVEATEALQPLAAALPSSAYAEVLEVRLMDEVDIQVQHDAQTATDASVVAARALPVHDTPRYQLEPVVANRSEKPIEFPAPRIKPPSRMARRRLLVWQLASVAAVLVIVAGALIAASYAPPDSLLYRVRRLEQNVRLQFAADPAQRARIQLAFTQDALSALESAINQQNYMAYSVNLEEFQDAFQDAETDVAAVPLTSQRADLEVRLGILSTRASDDLQQALGNVSWEDRVKTTAVMGKLHNTIPIIKLVTFNRGGVAPGRSPVSGGTVGAGLMIHIHGTGFASGAVLYVNNHPLGEVTKVTPNEIQAVLPGMSTLASGTIIGVSNPDGTAAQYTLTSTASSIPPGTPVITPDTHGNDDRGIHG